MTGSGRRPRSELPEDLCCHEAYCEAGPFKDIRGYIGHMAGKHRIKYEKKELIPAVEALAKLPNAVDREDLKPWMMFALARKFVMGMSYDQIGEEFGRAPTYLSDIGRSPAGKRYLASLMEQTDPVIMVKNMMDSDLIAKYLDWRLAWTWALENHDYDAIHRMAKDIGMKKILEDQSSQLPTQITINIGEKDLEIEAIETTYEIIDDANDESSN